MKWRAGIGLAGVAALAGATLWATSAQSAPSWDVRPTADEASALQLASTEPGPTVMVKQLSDGSRLAVSVAELERLEALHGELQGESSYSGSVDRFSELLTAPSLATTNENLLTLVPRPDVEVTTDASVFLAPLSPDGTSIPFCEAFGAQMEAVDLPEGAVLAAPTIGELAHTAETSEDTVAKRLGCGIVDDADGYGIVVTVPVTVEASVLEGVMADAAFS